MPRRQLEVTFVPPIRAGELWEIGTPTAGELYGKGAILRWALDQTVRHTEGDPEEVWAYLVSIWKEQAEGLGNLARQVVREQLSRLGLDGAVRAGEAAADESYLAQAYLSHKGLFSPVVRTDLLARELRGIPARGPKSRRLTLAFASVENAIDLQQYISWTPGYEIRRIGFLPEQVTGGAEMALRYAQAAPADHGKVRVFGDDFHLICSYTPLIRALASVNQGDWNGLMRAFLTSEYGGE